MSDDRSNASVLDFKRAAAMARLEKILSQYCVELIEDWADDLELAFPEYLAGKMHEIPCSRPT